MKKILPMIVLTLLLTACSAFPFHSQRDIFHYENSFVGDNAAVGNILSHLDIEYKEFSLSTANRPYGITLQNAQLSQDEIFNNSAFIFTLVPSADWITYNLSEGDVTIHRQQMADYFDFDLMENEETLRDTIEKVISTHGIPEFTDVHYDDGE